jgi:glycosyltransferase involved in cell wall biosynthesis
MTIVHLITELNMGGAEQMLHRLVRRMDRHRFRCLVVSMMDKGPIGKKIEAEGIPVVALHMTPGRPSVKGFAAFYHLLKQESVDIVQTWLYHSDLLGLITAKLAGVSRIVWGIRCSDMRFDLYGPLTFLTAQLGRILSSLPDGIIVNSVTGKEVHMRLGYRARRMVLIPNGIDTKLFRPDESARGWLLEGLGLPSDAHLIGLVARFDPMKDHANFLKAASLLCQLNPSVHFVMVGKDITAENQTLASFLNGCLKGRVHLLGQRTDIPRVTSALDIAASSSAFGEGFSNTIGEAMSCGVPCVVTDVGDSGRIVGDTGVVVAPGDAEALSQEWLKLLEMGRDQRRQLGRRARRRIVEHYEIGTTVKRFQEFYQGIMARRAGSQDDNEVSIA